MDEDASMPDLEVRDPEEDALLFGDRGYAGFIDGVHFHIARPGYAGFVDGLHFHIARPGIEVPVDADVEAGHRLQLPVWWQNRHVKTANDGHESADLEIRSYQIIQ